MDVFDDFEFKPLTEGLGFQKQAEKPQFNTVVSGANAANVTPREISSTHRSAERSFERSFELGNQRPPRAVKLEIENDLLDRETSRAPSKSISDLIASLPPSLDFIGDQEGETRPTSGSSRSAASALTEVEQVSHGDSRPQIYQPFARDEYKAPAFSAPVNGPTIGSVLPAPGTKASNLSSAVIPAPLNAPIGVPSPFRNRLDESFSKAFPQAKVDKKTDASAATEPSLEAIPVAIGAAIIDGMVVAGMSMIFLVCILLITKVNLTGLLGNAQTDLPTQVHLGLLVLANLQMYLLTSRSFFGSSLGEWAFELQLGTDADQKRAVYPLLVAWRSFLVTATGIVVLPLLSLIARRDLAKHLSGLQLYRRL